MVGWIDGEVLSPDGEAGQEPSEAMKEKRKAINQLIVDNGGNEFYFYGYDVSFIIDQTNAWEADYFNRIYTSTETDYQVHPMVFKFYCEMVGGNDACLWRSGREVMEKFVRSLHFNK